MSHTNLITINSTEINNSGPFRVGDNLSSGTAGQVLKSNGDNIAPSWETDIDTTYQGSATIDIDTTTDPDTINVIKVPNDLTISQNGTTIDTFNGSVAKTIDLEGKYSAGCGIEISGHPIPVIEADTDEVTITKNVSGTELLEVLKVPNDLTFTGYATGTFNGSSALNINLVDTTYTPGFGIAFSGTQINANPDNTTIDYNGAGYTLRVLKVPNTLTCGANLAFITGTDYDGSASRQIYLTKTPTGFNSITMSSTPIATTITGNTYPSNPTHCSYLDLTSSTNVFPKFVGGSEILKSLSYIDNTSQNYNSIANTAFKFFFDGSQTFGTDTLEIDFTATSTTGYCEYGFFANSLTTGMVFMTGIAAATGGTSPFSTTLGSGAVSIDAYKLGLFDGTTTRYSLKEILDFDGYENTYITSQFYFNNLSIGTRYRMALYGRCWSTGSIYINTGGKGTTGLADRQAHQPAFMKFYEYDSSIGGARTGGGGGGGGGF